MFSWWNASGGFFYHYLAWRFRKKLWIGFHKPLQNWILTWTQKNKTLVLFGPSGGYALNTEFLNRYSEFIVIEPDPIAIMVLKRRFHSVLSNKRVTWISDRTLLFDSDYGTSNLKKFLIENVSADLLFCNVIGQLPLFFPEKNPEKWIHWKTSFQQLLQSRNFLSFHDLCSSIRYPENWRKYAGNQTIDFTALFDKQRVTEVFDHQTQDLFSNLPKNHFLWRISTRRYHLIEGIHS